MVETLGVILPIIIYLLLIILLVTVVVLGIKIIKIINKANNIIEDIEYKMEAINNMFKFTYQISDKLYDSGKGLIDRVLNKINKMLRIRNREEDEDNG